MKTSCLITRGVYAILLLVGMHARASTPVYIKIEAEDMGGVASYRSNDPKDAFKPRMACPIGCFRRPHGTAFSTTSQR